MKKKITQKRKKVRHVRKYNKETLHRIMSRLYTEMREYGNISFKKLHGKVGTFSWDGDDVVVVDYRKDMLPTIIHEFLHKWHPDRPEKWVIAEESRIINALSLKQIRNFVRVLAEVFSLHKQHFYNGYKAVRPVAFTLPDIKWLILKFILSINIFSRLSWVKQSVHIISIHKTSSLLEFLIASLIKSWKLTSFLVL